MKRIIYGLFLVWLIPNNILVAQCNFDSDTIEKQTYTFGWGTPPNTDVLAMNGTSLTSFTFNHIDLKLKNSKLDNALIRSFNSVFVQYYLGGFVFTILPHELGHYYQARQAGIMPRKLNIPFPKIGGFILYDANYIDHTPEQRMLIASRGMETSASNNYITNTKFYSGRKVPQHYFWYYFNSKVIDAFYYSSISNLFVKSPTDYFEYIAEVIERKNGITAIEEPAIVDDPVNYLLSLTESYGYYDTIIDFSSAWVYRPENPDVYLNEFIVDQNKRMKTAYILQLVDPALLNSFYGLINYIAKGKIEHQPYMLKIKNTRFMPAIRANLGLLGVENYFDLYVKNDNLPPFNLYYRTGGNMFHSIFGGGVAVRELNIWRKFAVDAQADYWYNQRSSKSNFNLGFNFNYELHRNFQLVASANYKTKGSLVGKPVNEGFYGWLGFSLKL